MKLSFAATLALLGLALMAPAAAQVPPYVDSNCGVWQGDQWIPNGNCTPDTHRHERLAGTITAVKGHLVSVQQTDKTLVIDDSLALKNELTGRVAVGRQIVAHG